MGRSSKRPKQSNSYSHDPSTPDDPRQTASPNTDFSVMRQQDGHSPYGMGNMASNAHYPNAGDDMFAELDDLNPGYKHKY